MSHNLIQSVDRALQILSLFSPGKARLGITQISRELGLHKGTVQGLVRTLTSAGYLQQEEETRKYLLGLKIYELGVILAGSLEINQKASGPVHNLAKKTQHLIRVAILDRDSALVTLDAYPQPQPFLTWQFGPRAPLYCTALGKALVAFLSMEEIEEFARRARFVSYTPHTVSEKDILLKDLQETKIRGYSVNREEHVLARAAIGAPIFGGQGRPVASMCMVGSPDEILGKKRESLVKEVMKTALGISQVMGFSNRVHFSEDRIKG